MITRRGKQKELERPVTEDIAEKRNPEPGSSKKMTEKDKLEELHSLLVSMTAQFQSKLSEMSSTFHKEIQKSRVEINDVVDKKVQNMREELQHNEKFNSSKAKLTDGKAGFLEDHVSGEKTDKWTEYPHLTCTRSDHLIALPRFNGKPMEWPGFISQYKRTTETHHYDQVQNNIRLNEALSGDARKLVEPLLIHPKNVDRIIEDLEDRFGQPDLLIDDQLRNIRSFPNIADSQTHLIIELADRVRNCKNFFESCDCSAYLDNPLLVKEISGKLPFSYRIEWVKIEASLKYKATISDLSKWLTETSQYLHRLSFDRQLMSTSECHETQRQTYQKPKCDFCQETHPLENCQKFRDMDFDSRFQHARDARICFSCLKKGHPTKFCKNKKDCTVENCKHKHHILLHGDVSAANTESPTFFDSARIMHCNSSQMKILFQMIPIKIFGPKGSIQTFAMFDSASDISIMDSELANQLGIDGPEKSLNIQWLDKNTQNFKSKIADVNISGTFKNAPVFRLHNVRLMKKINLPSQSLNMEQINSRYNYLTNIPVDSYQNGSPKILLSLKEFRLTLSNQPPVSKGIGPIATKTKLGWMIYGPIENLNEREDVQRVYTTFEVREDEMLEDLNAAVHKFISCDEFGSGDCKHVQSGEEKRSFAILEKTTIRSEERYESGLLWKRENINLPNNYSYAVKRFESIEKKMDKDELYRNVYTTKINEYIKKGYAVQLSVEEAQKISPRTWYLPHFGVLNKNKPGKFRLVFDAAAKFQGISLNSSLMSGPDLNQPLVSVLLKFREKPIGVCGDIKEMFHQVLIRKEDQDSQRFVFRSDKKEPLKVFKMQAMTFGATCSPTTAQYVKNKNAQQFYKEFPQAVEAVLQNHYVDDYVCSFSSETEAVKITKEVIKIHKFAGFQLRGFVSNSSIVTKTLNSCQPTEEVSMDLGNNNPKILGLHWNLETDCFIFKTHMDRIDREITEYVRAPTKREVLSIVMSLFDPFGFIGSYTINGKLLLQSIWKKQIGWDAPISDDLLQTWKKWFNELPKVENLAIPRCYNMNLLQSIVQLHIFVDASSQAFAAVAYFRIITQENQISTSLICSKTKCAPLKYMSIPRLELQAALLGVRVMKSIIENQTIKFRDVFFWTDSSTVLHWIRNEKNQLKPFVANRVSEILETTSPNQWFKVPTKENVADQATRSTENVARTIGCHSWLHGPQWLLTSEWPEQTNLTLNHEGEKEIKTTKNVYVVKNQDHQSLICYERFSNYSRLVRAIAWVRRFIRNCSSSKNSSSTLSAQEVQEAEFVICKQVQKDTLQKEYADLRNQIPLEKSSSIYNLNPIIDDNKLIRVYGRINNAPTIPLFTKQPIIMTKSHYVTELLVRYIHNQCKHQLKEVIICEVRKKFWINDLRSLVNKVKATCQRCKILEAKPRMPLMGPHPEDRLTPFIRPFTYTGVDYFGPVSVSVGRSKQKRWVALFTCLTIRAVHTEIAEDLSSDACIMCIRNFINTRGVPKRMRSDNGSNFVGINNELMSADDIFQKDQVQDELSIRQIQWKFNVPSNPSAGGCWERMVQTIKRILVQSLKEVSPRVETLRSFLIEACNIVNSRPLTHVPTSVIEEEPLTPNCFLLGDPNCIQQFSDKEPEPIWTLRKQWRIANSLKNYFWKRFVREYLPNLNKRCKHFQPVSQIKVGDIVLVADDNLTKNIWPRGIVLEVFYGRDAVVRSALIRSKNKEIKRPASRLAVIGNINSQSKSVTLLLEGNIGCGKSTILKSISKLGNIEVFPEPVEKWMNCSGINLLKLCYEDPKKYGYNFQNYVFKTMRENHLKTTEKPIKMMERSLFSAGEIFTKNLFEEGSITEDQYEDLLQTYKRMIANDKIQPDVIIYIKTSPEVAFSRITSRRRPEEKNIDLNFIRSIHNLYETFIKNTKIDTIIIDGNRSLLEVLEEIRNVILNLETN